jgi:diguanylate cyclase (GGDEF)-like protein
MTGLPRALRGYLWALYGAAIALVAMQATLLPRLLAHLHRGDLAGAALFVLLVSLGERTTLQVTPAVNQNMAGALHIAAILLFPPPLPLAIALAASLAVEAPQTQRPAYKRAFNVCLSALSVGLSSLVVARLVSPASPVALAAGHAAALPTLALLLALYYALNSGLLLGVFCLQRRALPWRVWRATHQPTALPELAICALGVLAAVVWRVDPLLFGLFALPALALHAAVRTAARAVAAEGRAAAALAQASADGLTGLLNHRALHDRLDAEIAHAARTGRPLALVMIDLDDFRAINNGHGHQIGDAALVAIAAALRVSIRTADVAGRYGGDEFAVILPEADLDEALAVAERACAAIAAVVIPTRAAPVRPAASLGVAALPRHARTRAALIHAADHAAYAAKDAGKNRVRPAADTADTADTADAADTADSAPSVSLCLLPEHS